METGPPSEPYQSPYASAQTTALSPVPEGEAARPTGLTVLAVMNFIFGAGAIMSAISSVLMLPFMGKDGSLSKMIEDTKNVEGAPEWAVKMLDFSSEILTTEAMIVGAVLSLITGPLLLISGVGYLRQEKVKGWRVGNIYAVVGLVGVILGYIFWNLGMLNLLEFIYPVFTLVLLNSVFKNDFVR